MEYELLENWSEIGIFRELDLHGIGFGKEN